MSHLRKLPYHDLADPRRPGLRHWQESGSRPFDSFNLKLQLEVLSRQETALILAAMEGQTLVVEKLIAAGANLDVQNNYG